MEKAADKLKIIKDHLGRATEIEPKIIDLGGPDAVKPKYEYFKMDGWGYKDTQITFDREKNYGHITGSHYTFSGSVLKDLQKFAENEVGLRVAEAPVTSQPSMAVDPPFINESFLSDISGLYSRLSFDDRERITHSHGHTLREVYALKHGKFERFADCVVYPGCHEHVEALVKAALKHNVALIPYGGGTNVTQALWLCPEEKRMIVSVDMTRMNKIKWVDKENMMACIEAGIIGQDLDAELKKYGLCTGHEPDSVEFSTLGGWIATRASGMKKNYYGNIEDIVKNIKIVTPIVFDTYYKKNREHLKNRIITEAVLRIRPFAEVHEYDSVVFPCFEDGVKFMRDLARNRVHPASVRLVDNMQFRFAAAFSGTPTSTMKALMHKLAKFYLTKIKGYDPYKLSVATLLFEGSKEEVAYQKKLLYEIAAKYNGMRAGGDNGKRGYQLTFLIAYIRDFAMEHNFIAESLETSVPWSNVLTLCENTKKQIQETAKRLGVKREPFVTFRVTLLYETGATVYMYFGFHTDGLADSVKTYEEVEEEARWAMINAGGSLSHHHGIGKMRKKFMPHIMSSCGLDMIKGLKDKVDPNNTFATNNIIDVDTPKKSEEGKPVDHMH